MLNPVSGYSYGASVPSITMMRAMEDRRLAQANARRKLIAYLRKLNVEMTHALSAMRILATANDDRFVHWAEWTGLLNSADHDLLRGY